MTQRSFTYTVQTLWTAGLFHPEGNRNWQLYLVVSLALTIVVLLCWRLYVQVTKGRSGSLDTDNLFAP